MTPERSLHWRGINWEWRNERIATHGVLELEFVYFPEVQPGEEVEVWLDDNDTTGEAINFSAVGADETTALAALSAKLDLLAPLFLKANA
jgi:hypothetical protein